MALSLSTQATQGLGHSRRLLLVEGPEAAASSLVAALRAVAPRGMTRTEVVRRARRGIELVAAFSAAVMTLSSTHRELYGLAIFVSAAAVFLGYGRHQLIMDNLGCVFILGGYVPPLRCELQTLGGICLRRLARPAKARAAHS